MRIPSLMCFILVSSKKQKALFPKRQSSAKYNLYSYQQCKDHCVKVLQKNTILISQLLLFVPRHY